MPFVFHGLKKSCLKYKTHSVLVVVPPGYMRLERYSIILFLHDVTLVPLLQQGCKSSTRIRRS